MSSPSSSPIEGRWTIRETMGGRESCRNWIEAKNDRCGKPARYIVWGKLFDPEYLGPRCEDCAHGQVGYDALRPDAGYAIHCLPDSTQPNPIGDREQLQELHEDCILAAIGQDRLRAGLEEPGAGDIERGEAKECEGKAKAFREVADRIRIRDEQKAGS